MLIDTTFEEMVADFGTTGEFKQIEDIMSLITKNLDTLIWCRDFGNSTKPYVKIH